VRRVEAMVLGLAFVGFVQSLPQEQRDRLTQLLNEAIGATERRYRKALLTVVDGGPADTAG
jgi:hypothetical protein